MLDRTEDGIWSSRHERIYDAEASMDGYGAHTQASHAQDSYAQPYAYGDLDYAGHDVRGDVAGYDPRMTAHDEDEDRAYAAYARADLEDLRAGAVHEDDLRADGLETVMIAFPELPPEAHEWTGAQGASGMEQGSDRAEAWPEPDYAADYAAYARQDVHSADVGQADAGPEMTLQETAQPVSVVPEAVRQETLGQETGWAASQEADALAVSRPEIGADHPEERIEAPVSISPVSAEVPADTSGDIWAQHGGSDQRAPEPVVVAPDVKLHDGDLRGTEGVTVENVPPVVMRAESAALDGEQDEAAGRASRRVNWDGRKREEPRADRRRVKQGLSFLGLPAMRQASRKALSANGGFSRGRISWGGVAASVLVVSLLTSTGFAWTYRDALYERTVAMVSAGPAQGVSGKPVLTPVALKDLPAPVGPSALRADALAGDLAAAYEVGVRYAEGVGVTTNPEAAIQWLSHAVDKGYAPAAYRLASIYESGLGNVDEAYRFYKWAAQQGNVRAMHNLAVLYAQGISGSAPDWSQAISWFRQAAEHGMKDAQHNLGIIFARGLSGRSDLREALSWFSIAALQGDQDSASMRDILAKQTDPAVRAEATRAAEAFRPKPVNDAANTVVSRPEWSVVEANDTVAAAMPAAPAVEDSPFSDQVMSPQMLAAHLPVPLGGAVAR